MLAEGHHTMTTQAPKIGLSRLRQLVKEELSKVDESVDHKNINSIVGVATKLLAAVEAFKEKAPPAAVNATTSHLGELERVLDDMASFPGSYVPKIRKEPKKVSLSAKKALKEALLVEVVDVTGDPERVDITWDQVTQTFPEAAQKMQRDYAENVKIAQEDGDEPGVLPPDQMKWWVERFDPRDHSKRLQNSLPALPGYVLKGYDAEAIASFHGGGSELTWTGDDWEM